MIAIKIKYIKKLDSLICILTPNLFIFKFSLIKYNKFSLSSRTYSILSMLRVLLRCGLVKNYFNNF